jgi:hypothetical protein
MTTIPIYNLDDAEEVVQPSAGWHPAVVVEVDVAPNKAGTGYNLVLSTELAEDDPDRPGMPWTIYMPLPTEELAKDFNEWKKAGKPKRDWDQSMLLNDGRHKYSASLARLRKLSAALGGPESGPFKPEAIARKIGTKIKINLVPERDRVTGDSTGRMVVAFDGVAPA